jgi:hypothetical protein
MQRVVNVPTGSQADLLWCSELIDDGGVDLLVYVEWAKRITANMQLDLNDAL